MSDTQTGVDHATANPGHLVEGSRPPWRCITCGAGWRWRCSRCGHEWEGNFTCPECGISNELTRQRATTEAGSRFGDALADLFAFQQRWTGMETTDHEYELYRELSDIVSRLRANVAQGGA